MSIRILPGNVLSDVLIRLLAMLLITSCAKDGKVDLKEGEPVFAVTEDLITAAELDTVQIQIPIPSSVYQWPYGDYYNELGTVNFSLSGNYNAITKIPFRAANSDFNHVNMPIIVNNHIVIAEANGMVTSTAMSGYKTVWRFNIKAELADDVKSFRYAAISYGNDCIFLATNNGYIMALSFDKGQMLWKNNLRMPFNSPWKYKDNVIYGVSATSVTFAIDVSSGKTLWQHDGIAETRITVNQPSVLLHPDEALVISSHASGDIVALSEKNGTIKWGQNITSLSKEHDSGFKFSDIDANPALLNSTFMMSGGLNGSLAVIHIKSGAIAWQKPYGVTSQIAAVGDFAFFVDDAGHLICLHGPSGKIKWTQDLKNTIKLPLPRYINQGLQYKTVRIQYYGPTLINGAIVLINHMGALFQFDPQNGQLIEEKDLGFPVNHPPIIVDQKIYLVNDKSGYVAVME